MLAQLNCQSLEKLVIDNEYCGSALKLKQESESLALEDVHELIISVGPGGEFLKNRHTLKNYRTEHLFPSDIICRLNVNSWRDEGEKTTLERATTMVDDFLQEEPVVVLPKTTLTELEIVLKTAEKSFS